MGFNLAETLLRPVLRSAPVKATIGGLRYAGDHLGIGTGVFADAADMGTRALSGDNRNFNPKDFSKQTQDSFKQAIDNAVSRSPVQERYPIAPEYMPLFKGSSSLIISMALIFGAPETVPAGNVALNTSSGFVSSSI